MTDEQPRPADRDQPDRDQPDLDATTEFPADATVDFPSDATAELPMDAAAKADAVAEARVAATFAGFRAAQRGAGPAPAVESVFTAARRQQRRRHQAAGLAAAASLVLVAGGGVVLANTGGSEQPTHTAERPTRAAGSESASPTDAPPSPTPDPTDDDTTSEPRGPRQIDLRNATVAVPPMRTREGCPGGELRFADGVAKDSAGCVWRIAKGGVRYADLDGARGEEIVTTLDAGEPNSEFTSGVIGLRSPSGGGTVRPMEYVFTGESSGQFIESIRAARSGLVTVDIGDASRHPADPQRQQRTYRWTGSGFTQVRGPTAFPEPSHQPSEPTPSDSRSPDSGGEPEQEPQE